MAAPNFFFLLVSPPEKVMEEVTFFKKLIFEILGHFYRSLHSTAHLSLLQYYDFHNESLLYTFSERLARIKPFEIFIDGFGAFERNGTIYLKITNRLPFSELSELLVGHAIVPHITVARGLKPGEFEKVWGSVKDVPFKYRFICDRVTVLKRVDNRWRPHTELLFSTPFTSACVPTGHEMNVSQLPHRSQL